LFSIKGADLCDTSLNPPEYSPVKWLQGIDIDDSAPQYLISSQRQRGMLDKADSSKLLVKIGDMGGGNVTFAAIQISIIEH
jgi:serine/threonine-protein kinase SRPK3